MLHRFLLGTRFGEWLLGLFERTTGLAIVDVDWLAEQRWIAATNSGE
jgi:hypothetical protein